VRYSKVTWAKHARIIGAMIKGEKTGSGCGALVWFGGPTSSALGPWWAVKLVTLKSQPKFLPY